jgi:hypothetical protein
MKGFIRLTNSGGDLLVPVESIAFVETLYADGLHKSRVRMVGVTDHVRESPQEIAALIRKAQAPSVDEVAAQVLCSIYRPDYEHESRDAVQVHIAYQIADALIAERARRNATAPTLSTPASPETAPLEGDSHGA